MAHAVICKINIPATVLPIITEIIVRTVSIMLYAALDIGVLLKSICGTVGYMVARLVCNPTITGSVQLSRLRVTSLYELFAYTCFASCIQIYLL